MDITALLAGVQPWVGYALPVCFWLGLLITGTGLRDVRLTWRDAAKRPALPRVAAIRLVPGLLCLALAALLFILDA